MMSRSLSLSRWTRRSWQRRRQRQQRRFGRPKSLRSSPTSHRTWQATKQVHREAIQGGCMLPLA